MILLSQAPNPPTDLQATSGTDVIVLTWQPPIEENPYPTAYKIYRNGDLIAGNDLDVTRPTFTDRNISPGMVYVYYVTAVNTEQNLESSPSNVDTAEINLFENRNIISPKNENGTWYMITKTPVRFSIGFSFYDGEDSKRVGGKIYSAYNHPLFEIGWGYSDKLVRTGSWPDRKRTVYPFFDLFGKFKMDFRPKSKNNIMVPYVGINTGFCKKGTYLTFPIGINVLEINEFGLSYELDTNFAAFNNGNENDFVYSHNVLFSVRFNY